MWLSKLLTSWLQEVKELKRKGQCPTISYKGKSTMTERPLQDPTLEDSNISQQHHSGEEAFGGCSRCKL
jgi:hypothetical protein